MQFPVIKRAERRRTPLADYTAIAMVRDIVEVAVNDVRIFESFGDRGKASSVSKPIIRVQKSDSVAGIGG